MNFRRLTAVVVALVLPVGVAANSSPAQAGRVGSPAPVTPADPDTSRLSNPADILGNGWKSASDRAVSVAGDSGGLHVLVAEEANAYQWRIAATLGDPGYDVDQWIGRSCVTGSGRRAVVVYAPRVFTNHEQARDMGGSVAIVDLSTGAVTKLRLHASLAYFNPGCGVDERVAVTAFSGGQTTVAIVDTVTATTSSTLSVAGQVTSAVPYAGGVAAAMGTDLVSLSGKGRSTVLSKAGTVPFRLHPDRGGGLAYQVPVGDKVEVRRFAGGRSRLLGTGTLGALTLRASAGHVFVLGPDAGKTKIDPASQWSILDAPVDSEPSTTGALVITRSTTQTRSGPGKAVTLEATATGTRKKVSFSIATTAGAKTATSASSGTAALSLSPSTDTTDPDRGCSIARNDPAKQALQPTAKQVEWAADLAVMGQLNVYRPANWAGSGMPVSWTPQGLFPRHNLTGGANVPVQVLLGILAQESNTMHASPHAVDGETGNFNQGGFYGNRVSWSTVDCGYGVGQITTGMSMAEGNSVYTANQRLAIATDYASNIAAAVNALVDKWNALAAANIMANNGDANFIENWYLAAWAYNTGIQPAGPKFGNTTGCTPSPSCTDGRGNWGLGWSNNPANPSYPVDRPLFNANNGYATKHPDEWPYQEKIIGWAATPVMRFNWASHSWEQSYRPGRWNSGSLPKMAGKSQFCVSTINHCNPGAGTDIKGKPGAGACVSRDANNLLDYHCWWHESANQFANCVIGGDCGSSDFAYSVGAAEPPNGSVFPQSCTSSLPAGAVIVDDTTARSPFASCNPNWSNSGTLTWDFAYSAQSGCSPNCVNYKSKIDFHQIGGTGFGGHIWFAHTTTDTALTVTGTWTANTPFNGWTRVLVHIPDNGAWTQQAHYIINTGSARRERFINTNRSRNYWTNLGTYLFSSTGAQNVQLSNATGDGRNVTDIAWDAVAFVPLAAKPAHFVVAIGDSYESGEGVGSYLPETDINYTNYGWNACRRSTASWPRKTILPGIPGSNIGALADANDPRLDFADVSCSGARTYEMGRVSSTPYYWQSPPSDMKQFHVDANGQFGEVAQADSGVLSADTTLVLLSAGGNDAGFSDTLVECAPIACQGNQSGYQKQIDDAQGNISTLISIVRSKAPNATIVLVGYPKLFADMPLATYSVLVLPVYTATEMGMFNDLARYMRDKQQATVNSFNDPKIRFVDMITPFGDYGCCKASINYVDLEEDINAIVIGSTGPGDFSQDSGACPIDRWLNAISICISRSSLHPNNLAPTRQAGAVTSALINIGYH
jgi:hypothetical protein